MFPRVGKQMNQSFFLHIVERLEGFVGKLPASIQKPILSEITPLKELFLQQRPPRFVLTGSNRLPLHEFVRAIFDSTEEEESITTSLTGVYQWQEVAVGQHGTASFLDARGADDAALLHVHEELKRRAADMFFFLHDDRDPDARQQDEADNIAAIVAWNEPGNAAAKIAVIDVSSRGVPPDSDNGVTTHGSDSLIPTIHPTLTAKPLVRDKLLRAFAFPLRARAAEALTQTLMSTLTQELPNEARVEMIRISRDRQAQLAIAQTLVKSTTAICTAVGAQPIPLADLPILTTLQLVMVSGIMYISGRERSMRAATEFTAALGANVGVGMVMREGARALLKFVPGWGNVVCGMVAGAGTYAIGRSATVYFLEGGSLKDARRTFRLTRTKADVVRKLGRRGSEQPVAADPPV
jgi:uncharacterized protein (DUF697 family)